MKKNFFSLLLIVLIFGFLPGISLAETITKVGEWGSAHYESVFVKGNYAYCSTGYGGLDIIDISTPSSPKKVSNYIINDKIHSTMVIGNNAYVAAGTQGLHVLDVSNPSSPSLKGSWQTTGNVKDIMSQGNYAYLANGSEGLTIMDISNPSNPTLTGSCDTPPEEGTSIYVSGNYAYMATVGIDDHLNQYSRLYIFDISSPASPNLLGKTYAYDLIEALDIDVKDKYVYITGFGVGLKIFDISDPANPTAAAGFTEMDAGRGIFIQGDYAYVGSGDTGLLVFDISSPPAATLIGNYNTSGDSSGVMIDGNFAYVADREGGLQIINISTPSNPTLVGNFDNSIWYESEVCVKGNYVYLASGPDGIYIIDVSTPSTPTLAGNYDTEWARAVDVKGNLAYVADDTGGLLIIDISNPSVPFLKGSCPTPISAFDVYVDGNYAYVADWGDDSLAIIDISNPSSPGQVAKQEITGSAIGVYVSGNHAYVADSWNGLKIINIANPSAPELESAYDIPEGARNVFVTGHYAYVGSDYEKDLWILDVSLPSAPSLVKRYTMADWVRDLHVSDNYLYAANYRQGLTVMDVTLPSSPVVAADFTSAYYAHSVAVSGDYIYLSNHFTSKLFILHLDKSTTPPRINVNHTEFYFASDHVGQTTSPQSLLISNSGAGTLNWSVTADENWLQYTPSSGSGSGEITVSVDPAGLSPGTYTANLTLSASQAANSPFTVEVHLQVYGQGQTSGPFGVFATPNTVLKISSSVPFTGWVLDDIGVQGVQLFRGTTQGLVYIGDAVLVEGARPDVEQSYPGYPMNYKAGWGYMMLTNFLPNGNGTFAIQAIATDLEGNQVTLGTKTIYVDNANAVNPFGALDTPPQGGTASGSEYINFGWVLTPLPNTIPTDGSTIQVWVDGVSLGHPVYNKYREDIADLFPGYNNSNGAGGYFYLDTTQFSSGVHTIQWTATDDAGNTDGIGSRYFTIQNSSNKQQAKRSGIEQQVIGSSIETLPGISRIPVEDSRPVGITTGYNDNIQPENHFPDHMGNLKIEIKELERLAIHFNQYSTPGDTSIDRYTGYLVVGNQLRPLPIGSFLDPEQGIFCWQAGIGFMGRYRFIFLEKDQKGNPISRWNVSVVISPRF